MLNARGLRKRLLISFALMAIAVAGIALPLASRLIDGNFSEFEIGKARSDADRLQLLLSEKTDRIRANAVDYANWSSAVDYIRGQNLTFIEDNFFPDALFNFDADCVFIADQALSVRYYAGTAAYAGLAPRDTLAMLPHDQLQPLLQDDRIRSLQANGKSIGFVRRINGRWHLVGVSAITYANGQPDDSSYGVIGFVSELTPARMRHIRTLAQVPFELTGLSTQSESTWLRHGYIETHRLLRDTDGQPMAMVDIHYPRVLAQQIRVTRRLLLTLSIGVFVIGSALVWLLVDRGIISRLERMDAQLRAIGSGERTALPVGRRDDEVDRIASGFNRLYAELSLVNQQWRHEALHDALTGLGNRAQLLRQIEMRIYEAAGSDSVALLLLDLDGFKTINDVYGHAVGDRVLKRVADCLRTELPKQALCFRLGGDEFAVLVDGYDEAKVRALATHINTVIRSMPLAESAGAVLSASVGVAWLPADERVMVPSELMQRADIALYSIKRRDRDGYALFDDSMLFELQQQSDIQRSLREAIDRGGIEAWFQPIVSAADHRVLRFEALARWQHAEHGWMEPTRFVAAAEQHFIAAALDLAVLRSALQALPAIRAQLPGIGISVNVSAQSLLDGDYVGEVLALLDQAGLQGEDLVLEITETTLTHNEDALSEPIARLRAHGVLIELDDFGVGHSSLGRLAQIQPRGIKLDGSFVRNRHVGGDRVCRAVIGLAQELGITVTAECVEHGDDAKFLAESGCDALQGYLFSEPRPLAGSLAWLARQTPLDGVTVIASVHPE